MADITFDDLIPNSAPAPAVGGGVAFDDLVPEDKRPSLRAYEPTWQDRVGALIAGDSKPHEFWGRMARVLVGSRGAGNDPVPMGESGFGVSAADLFPPTAVAFSADKAERAAESGQPLSAALHALGVIPAPGASAVAARAAAPTVAEKTAQAAERLGVAATRATDSKIAGYMKEAPTMLENPVRSAASRELEDIGKAQERVLNKASRHYRPSDAADRALNDWLMGRTPSDEAAQAELNALRQAEAPPAAPVQRDTIEVVTPDQSMTVKAKPELVELSELQLAQGKFQPRDRSRAEYAQEARERAARLDPEQLKPGRVSDSGAPIILEDGTIISGNGRIMSIAEVYTNPALAERAAAYRASLGPDAANMRQPVLVLRAEAMTPDAASRFADLSNRGRIAAMSATERAARDASALDLEGIALYQGGEFTAPQNAEFFRLFTGKVVGPTERAAFSRGGELTQEGVARMRAAVLHGAYGDSAMLSRMLESTDDNIRNITGALTDAAPGVAQLRADVAAGRVMGELDTTEKIVDAVKLIADLRSRGVSPATHFAQMDAFAERDPFVEAWVRAFYNDDLSRPVSRQKMTEVLNAYTTEARKHQPGGLFEDTTTAGDVLNVARRQASETPEKLPDVAPAVGQSVRDGGPEVQRQPASDIGEAASGGGNVPQGDRGAAAAGDTSAGQAGKPVLTQAQSSQVVVRNLVEARKAALAKAIGEPTGGLTPGRLSERLVEMARSKLPADVNGLVRARELIGNESWRDVSAGILHRIGLNNGVWDVQTFARAYGQMTKTGQQVLFSGKGMPRGLRQSLDDLALLAARIPKLQKLSNTELPQWLDTLINSKASTFGWLVLHPISGFATLAPQATGWAIAQFIARPMRSKAVSLWAKAMAGFADDVTPKTVAMARFATQSLIDAAEREDSDGSPE